MSWQDRTENSRFSISTGDGQIFYPLWRVEETEKNTDFNTTEFLFIDVPGALVERRQPQGGKYPLIFYFQGLDNIEQTDAFELSAKDNRFWTVSHPFYGIIKGQPVSITRKDMLNITQVEVPFWESIDADYPNTQFDIKDNTVAQKNEVLESSSTAFATSDNCESEDINKIKESNAQTNKVFSGIQTNETSSDYANAYASAQKALDNLLTDPYNAIIKTQALFDIPASYDIPVLDRLKAFYDAFKRLVTGITTLGEKQFYEAQGAAAIASYITSAVTPIDGDYAIVPDVEKASFDLRAMYDEYLSVLDNATVSQNDIENAWQPDAEVQLDLKNIVEYTIANLYVLAFNAQQERVVYTEKDTNIILLVHRYMGLDANDENLEQFAIINKIRLNERFRIKKGRKILYYV